MCVCLYVASTGMTDDLLAVWFQMMSRTAGAKVDLLAQVSV